MITTYTQLIQEIDDFTALYHREEEGDNLRNMEMLTGIEYNAGRAITEYALSKGLDFNIGRFKLSFIYNDDGEDPRYDVLEGYSGELIMTFIEMLASPETVINHHPIKNKYKELIDPDPELVAAAKHFYKSFWPDYEE